VALCWSPFIVATITDGGLAGPLWLRDLPARHGRPGLPRGGGVVLGERRALPVG